MYQNCVMCYFADKGLWSHGAKENLPGIRSSVLRPHSARLSDAASAPQLWPPAQQALRHSTGSLKAVLAKSSPTSSTKV